jgi:hypothetical protein
MIKIPAITAKTIIALLTFHLDNRLLFNNHNYILH